MSPGQPPRQRTGTPAAPPVSDDRNRLVDAHDHAAAFFANHLRGARGLCPRGYLHRRGIGALLDAPPWPIGYAPPGWTSLTRHLRAAGFTDDELLLAGLAQRTRRGTVVDRFRDRVTFGMRDPAGRLVGFVARCAPGERAEVAKYLNTPRSPIYDKGTVLFGLAEQRDELAAGATPVLVEGPIDVLAVAAARGDGAASLTAVAPCGTALTEAHVAALRSVSRSQVVEVAFDPDGAGDRAAATAYQLLARCFPQLRTARLPPGTDPADLLTRHGPGRLRATLTDSQPLADRVVDRVLGRYRDRDDNAEARVAALHEVAPVIARMPPPDVAREVARVATALRFDHPLVTEEVTDAVAAQPGHCRRPSTAAPATAPSTGTTPTRARQPSMRLH